jgi:hypothetical protein
MVAQAELEQIQDRYRVKDRDWLDLEIEYQGPGEAEFSSNPGTLRGPMSIRYGEDGSAEVFEMTVEELTADQHPGGDASAALFAFVNGLPIPGEPGAFGFGPSSNKCVRVELTGDGFTVSPAQRSEVIASTGNGTATFRPYRTVASFAGNAEPHYWAVPLLNFTSGFELVAEDLHDHPLRTRETRPYEAVTGETALYHQLAYRQGNALIPFMCEGEVGFIEALPDYEARQTRVEAGETVATAVMVGRVRKGFDAAADQDWFPSDLVTLLGLATGRGVGVPFVELRGPSGELVARLHASIGRTTGGRRPGLIEEPIDRSTGALLSAFLRSEHRDQPWLRVALRHLLSALTGDMTVEDRLSHLFRTTEGLCVGLGLKKSRPLELTSDVREQVISSLDQCIDALDAIASSVTTPDRERVWSLKGRVKAIESNQPSFPTQLLGLVEQVALPDAVWLRDFRFRTRVDGPTEAWASAAGSYRNRIFHAAFIDFEKYDIDNVVPFISHLSDVLVRVVFQLIGFEGQYKPPCGAHGATMHEKPDWPKSAQLGPAFFRYVQ